MKRIKNYVIIVLVLSYILVHILLMCSTLNFDNPFNPFINSIIYIMGFPEYLAISLYSIDFSRMKGVSAFFHMERFSDLLSIKEDLGLFVTITLIIACITAIIYGSLAMLLMGVASAKNRPEISQVLFFSIFIGNVFLCPCLAIHAHIHKRIIEKYIHLFYMMLGPILPFFLPSIFGFHSIIFNGVFGVIIIIIPFLFVSKNYYLRYRDYKKELSNDKS